MHVQKDGGGYGIPKSLIGLLAQDVRYTAIYRWVSTVLGTMTGSVASFKWQAVTARSDMSSTELTEQGA